MKSLLEYIYGNENVLDIGDEEVALLSTCIVIKNEITVSIDSKTIDLSLGHKNLIDQCIIILLQKKLLGHVLVTGYKLAKNDSIRSVLHSDVSNSSVAILKSKQWEKLHLLMGTQKFLDLIFNYSVFWYNELNFVQVIGNVFNKPNVPPKWLSMSDEKSSLVLKSMYVHNKGYLYYDAMSFRTDSILFNKNIRKLSDAEKILALKKTIFEIDISLINETEICSLSADPKVNSILRNVVLKEKKIKYRSILENICPKQLIRSPHISNVVPTKCISRFVIVLLEKMGICNLLGTKKNKAIIFKHILPFLTLPVNGKILLTEIINDLKKNVVDNQQLTKRSYSFLLVSITFYIFDKLIPAILRCFFYATEISSFTEVLFFRRDVWNTISKQFLETYFDKYLISNSRCTEHDSYMNSNYNHCKLRLIPKKADKEFRVIGIPKKGSNHEEHLIFKQYLFKVLMPTRILLDYVRRQRRTIFKKLYSTAQICTYLKDYKIQLLNTYGRIPELYFLKFDIANCYDSIPIKKVKSVIKELLDKSDSDKFFVKNISLLNVKTGDFRTTPLINGVSNIKNYELIADNLSTTMLMKNEILDLISFEISNTAITFRGECFLRKDGLFQGQNLSATLVDILYDDMLEFYDEFKCFSDEHNLVLRHADDFLFISTDLNIIQKLKEKVLHGFPEYGAYVKPQKVILDSSNSSSRGYMCFCGLDIKLKVLEIIKPYTSMNQTKVTGIDSSSFFEKIVNLYKLRLNYGTLDFELNSVGTILDQIRNSVKNISLIIIDSRYNFLSDKEFYLFEDQLINETLSHCKHSRSQKDINKSYFKTCVNVIILTTMKEVLLQKQSFYRHIISVIKNKLEILKLHVNVNSL